MKTKMIILSLIMMFVTTQSLKAQSAAVADISTSGVGITPSIAAKLCRIELIKTKKYTVIDEFDMETLLEGKGDFYECYGKNCLLEMGKTLNVDYLISGSIDKIGPKIIISLKMVDVVNETVSMTKSLEFDDQVDELHRMIEIVLQEMLGLTVNEENKKRLIFKNELITSTNVGKVGNAGPRFGLSYVAFGDLADFFTRDLREGGLESVPVMSNLGYQFEVQYVGTENFSALFEIIPNVGGLEQGHFIPTISFLNGFRFGQSGWEFAFGPSFGARKMIEGIDVEGVFQTKNDYLDNDYNNWQSNPSNFDSLGQAYTPYQAPIESWTKRMDTRGKLEFNTNWLMAIGRTFKAGSLNIPVNVYYSGNKYGGVFGASVGFNIIKSKKSIN